MSFHQYSKKILTDYLGTVAYVDDLIFRDKSLEAEPIKIEKPTRESFVSGQEKTNEDSSNMVVQESKRNIDPKKFTDAFMQKGIHCALFEIENAEDSLDAIKRTLRKSDVVILDWQMHFDNGKKAQELLFSVINSPENTELRLIIIFTNDPQYRNLLTEIIIPKIKELGIDGSLDNTGCIYKFGHSKILILEKTNGRESDTAITDEQLPDRIIEEFTELTKGLVSNTVLASLSAIRNNTHQLLSIFNKELDPAFLSHRSLLPNPNDSEEQILDLIGSEIKYILHKNSTVEPASIGAIQRYFTEILPEEDIEFIFPVKDGFEIIQIPEKIDRKTLIRIVELGIERVFLKIDNPTVDKQRFSDNCYQNLTEQFCKSKTLALKSNYKYALLTTNKNIYNKRNLPQLTLGAILKFESPSIIEYWLCIQPKCDSVRIMGKTRDFLFAKLNLLPELKKSDIITFHNGTILHFGIEFSIYKAKFFNFKANYHQSVRAVIEGEKTIFIGEKKMEWLGSLKDDFAQDISNKFGTSLSRVGTNPSEWLRRS